MFDHRHPVTTCFEKQPTQLARPAEQFPDLSELLCCVFALHRLYVIALALYVTAVVSLVGIGRAWKSQVKFFFFFFFTSSTHVRDAAIYKQPVPIAAQFSGVLSYFTQTYTDYVWGENL